MQIKQEPAGNHEKAPSLKIPPYSEGGMMSMKEAEEEKQNFKKVLEECITYILRR